MQITLKNKTYKLKNLTDQEYDLAAKLAKSKLPIDQCPTCNSKMEVIPGSGGVRERITGTYKYMGKEYNCECDAQIALRSRYLVANIGEQYQRLDWAEWSGCQETKEIVDLYLNGWEQFFRQGMGIEFFSPALGTGKTFAATHIGKELIKQGQSVYFIPFIEMVAAFDRQDSDYIASRVRESGFVILDEVIPPVSEAQKSFFATQLEALIRHRTNNNLPTIMTTNMDQETLSSAYPRTYSLLSAKQMRQEVKGTDRREFIGRKEMEIIANGETRPIT
jgi:DNA replication protein DnaC